MKKLLAKIRKILRDRRTRRFLTRFVSGIAAIVVFVTTYALVLPAITMEKEADCGIEAHQHDDSCYTRELICDIPESDGHQHGESCYSTTTSLMCGMDEHVHSLENGCYDDDGNLICEAEEHKHSDRCYEEVRELTCQTQESEGHHHTDACYEKVLSCGKEVHVHSAACYENDPVPDSAVAAGTSSAAAATTSAVSVSSVGMTLSFEGDNAGTGETDEAAAADRPADHGGSADDGGFVDNAGSVERDESGKSDGSEKSAGSGKTDSSVEAASSGEVNAGDTVEMTYGSENAGTGSTETANVALTNTDNGPAAADQYVPALEAVDFNTILNDRTGIYYYHVADGEIVEDSSAIPAEDWKRIPNNKERMKNMDEPELGSNDLLRVYLSYTIPAGSLNATNPVARYRLPSNLHLTDSQVKAINENVNGMTGQYVDMSALEITDPARYYAYLGVEAVEGNRRPDEAVEDYLAEQARKTGTDPDEAAEYISAVVRVENVYDVDGIYGDKDAYLGQDLIFTFAPYSIEKNQHEYDSKGQPTKAGREIEGWFTLDLNMGQVDLGEAEITTSTVVESEADSDYADGNAEADRAEDGRTEADRAEDGRTEDDRTEDDRAEDGRTEDENAADSQTEDEHNANDNNAENSVEDKDNNPAGESEEDTENPQNNTVTIERAERTAEIVFVEDGRDGKNNKIEKISTRVTVVEETVIQTQDNDAEENSEESGAGNTEKSAAGSTEESAADNDADRSGKEKTDQTVMPAMSFTDSIRVSTGKPAGIDEDAEGTLGSAVRSLPQEAEVTVRVEADEGTFPAGTTMVLKAVEDLDAVAEAVTETVENSDPSVSADDADHQSEQTKESRNRNTEEKKNLKTYGFQAVDITFLDKNGKDIQPAKPVRVALTSEIAEQVKEEAKTSEVADPLVVHVDDDGNAEQMELLAPEEIKPAQGKTEEELLEEDRTSNSEQEENGTTDAAGETPSVGFTADSFSVYALVYTVDFAYEEYTYSIRGGNSILLSDMVKELHISDNDAAFMSRVKNVEFTDPALMRVTYINNPTTVAAVEEYIFDGVFDDAEKEPGSNRKLDEGEWLLTSLAPFKTEEALTITLDSGRQIVITVLDGQEVAGNTFITDAHLTIDGTTYGKDEPWTVYPDVGYTMKLSFAEKGQNQFPAGGDTIVVDLPQGLTIPEGEHHTFTIPAGLAGSITGNEYWVENGKIYVKFGEDPDDILTRSSNAHFDLIFTAKFEEGTTQIPFNDKVKPNIDMDTTADVSVSKSASYNSATGKMDYTITVKSTGNSEDVKVHDALANTNLLKIDTGSITVSPGGTEYTVTNSSQSGFDMTIPSIGHNQTVTITYSADVDTSALDHKGNIKVSEDGKNTVTVENDDDDHDEDTNTYTNQIKYSSTSKSSTSMEDHEEEQTATLGWKIVLNDNYRGSIVGDKVWDTIDWSSKDAMKYTVDENGNVSLHIAAKNQDGTKTYDTTVTAAVVTDPNGIQSWEYTIPQLGADPDEILSYEITYTTEVDKTKLDSSSNGIVKNNTTNEGDGSSTGTGVVPIPHSDEPGEDDIVGGKTAVNVTAEYVDWDIVINVPAEGFPEGLTVTDYVPMAPQYGGFADTFDSVLSVTGLVHDETYTVNCVSTDVDDDGNVIWNLRNYGRTRDVVTIEFYQDAQKTTKGLEGGQARTVTIKIRTKNDPEWLAYVEREGSGDSNSFYHTNIAKANNTTFEGKAAPQNSKIYKSLIASDEKADDGMPVYQYAVDLASVRSLPVVIEDTFNADELEYYAYWYETDNHQYIDGKSQRHMLNNGISPYKASIVAENGKITITATDLPKKDNGDFWEYYRIYYKLKIKNQAVLDSFTQKAIENGGVYYVRNTAAWNGTDDHVDIEFKVPTVEKTGAFRINQGESGNNRLYDFAIDINKECLELNAGEPMDLTDTHTDNLTVDYTTVKVYKYVDGEKTPDTSIQWNFNGNIGTFYDLQDCTHYVIEYSCLVIGSATQSFSNYAEMNGYHSEKHDSRDFGTTVEAGADVFQIGLIKFKNGMTSQGLAGATFQLFRGTGSFHEVTNGTDTWMEEDRIPMTWGVGTETAGKVGQNITFTTGEDGYVLIALDQTKHGSELEKGVHYFLKEIESPPGYQIDSSVEYWEFTLTMDPDEVSYGTERDQYGNRLWIYFYYDDILKMNNTETDEPITVNVDKEWFDIEGNKIENPEGLTAEVQLYQKKNNEDYAAVDTITNADGTIYNGKITLPADGSWEYSWENLPRVDTDGNGYAYKLEEVEVPEDYVSSYTLNETENEKNYHLKNYRVTERKVNVSVSKTWLDEDGKTEIDINDLPEDLQEVQFYLYRVISRAPFTAAPTSGGNPYTIEGNQYLVTGPDAEDGLYKITREQFQAGISFEELPSVHKDDDGTWYFYSYYVKEVPVDGYSASVDVTETQDEQNNTILLSSMKNKKKPEERTTNFSVQKVWKDKEGGDKSWPDNTVVRFKLYQVTGTTPFDEQPTSGGVLYNVAQVNYNDHPNKVSGEDGLYQIGHTYQGSVLETAEFENLPEVTIDASGRATYNAYYVDEIEVSGYETSYSYVDEDGTVKVTITNRQEPEYTQLSVQKTWYDGDNEITDANVLEKLSATVELVRYRSVPSGTTVHFTMYNSAEDLASVLVPRNQTGVNITINSITGGANAKFAQAFTPTDEFYKVSGEGWGWIQGATTKTITTPDASDVYIVFGDGTVSSIDVSTTSAVSGGAAALDPTFDSAPYQIELNREHNFAYTYTKLLTAGVGSDDGQTYVYTYGVREVSNPSGFIFDSYSVGSNAEDGSDIPASNPGTAGTAIIVKNIKNELLGSLKLTKEVTVNGHDTTTNLADGAYVFSIAGPDSETIVKHVQITVTDGKAASYKVADGPDALDWTSVEAAYTFAADAVTREAVVSDLTAGEYTITEAEVAGMTTTVSGGKENKNNYTANNITVTVTAGNTVNATAKATFTNDKTPMTSFNFNKIWLGPTGNVATPTSYQDWQDDITVTIKRKAGASGAEDNNFVLKYTISKSEDTFTATSDTTESKLPNGEGNLTDLTLTGSSTDNVFNFNLPEESLRKYNDDGTEWVYYVVEDEVPLYVTSYGTATTSESTTAYSITNGASDAKDGGVIVNQTFGGYELPSTGGMGTNLLYLIGSMLIMLASAGFILLQRKKRVE